MGGIRERMVRSVRRALLSLTEERTMTEHQLRTFLFEVEAIVNSRPLTPITPEMDSELPLTPNHFLRPNAVAGLPPIIASTKDDHPRQGWRYVQTAADHFWRRFSKEYLRTILPRQKWHDTKNNLEVDDIVLAVDNNCPRSQWPLGGIVETYPDEHGVVRSVLVRINGHDVRRPIHKLCLIQPARENSPSNLEPVRMASEDLSSTSVEEPRARNRVRMHARSRVQLRARIRVRLRARDRVRMPERKCLRTCARSRVRMNKGSRVRASAKI